MAGKYVLAIYEIDRVYGGPEEGGWWYDTGKLARVLGTRSTEDAAYALARRLNGWLGKLQRNRREVGSVIYAGGRHSVCVYREAPPPFYPVERPYYS